MATAVAIRNVLSSRIERDRRTLNDLGYSPDTIEAILETPPVRAAIIGRRKYLAKTALGGARKRAFKANTEKLKAAQAAPAKPAEPVVAPLPTFNDIFGTAA